MIEATYQLKLYSMSEAAAVMSIGRDTLRGLIAEGKIGYILVGSSKRIPHQELIRFQTENTIRKALPVFSSTRSDTEVLKIVSRKKPSKILDLHSKQILHNIIRRDKNGNSEKKRKSNTHSMV